MDVTVNTSLLVHELKLLDKIVSTKATQPVLSNILLHADGQLSLSATDLELGLTSSVSAWIGRPGTTTLPSKKFLAIIDQLPDADVQITQEGNAAKIVCGAFTSRLQTWRAEDFPALPPQEGNVVSFPTPMLCGVIERTRYAVSEKGEKRELSNAMLSVLDNELTIVSTDGKRLSLAKIPGVEGAVSALLPVKTMDVIKSLNMDGAVEFSRNDQHIFFKIGPRTLYSRVFDGQFPNYRRVIPTDLTLKATIGRAQLAATLRRVGLVADDTTQGVSFTFTEGQLRIQSQSAQVGDADEVISIDYAGPEVKITLNWRLLLDFLEKATGKTIDLAFNEKDTRGILLTDGDNFLNVVIVLR